MKSTPGPEHYRLIADVLALARNFDTETGVDAVVDSICAQSRSELDELVIAAIALVRNVVTLAVVGGIGTDTDALFDRLIASAAALAPPSE